MPSVRCQPPPGLGPGGDHDPRGRRPLPSRIMRALRLALLLLAIHSLPASGQSEPAAAYSDWAGLLSRYVVGDHVQYARWKSENPAAWRRFLAWLEEADPSNLPADEQRAFWINAYNARVVAGVLAHLPLESVKDV